MRSSSKPKDIADQRREYPQSAIVPPASASYSQSGSQLNRSRRLSSHIALSKLCSPRGWPTRSRRSRSEEHTSELQSQSNLVCRLLLEKKKKKKPLYTPTTVAPLSITTTSLS